MSTSAQSIIESAFARSTASDAGKLAVDGELISHLNREYQNMHGLMAIHQPDNALAVIALTFAGVPASASLPTDIIDIVRLESSVDATRAQLVPTADKDRTYHLKPAVHRKGNTLISVGRTGDPIVGTVLTMYYTDAPAAITALASTLDARFPVRFENVLVLSCAVYLSIKDEGRDASRMAALKREWQDEYTKFLTLIGASNTATGREPGSTMAVGPGQAKA